MNRRTEYTAALLGAAGRCNIDAPRTEVACAKEAQQRGIGLHFDRGHIYLKRTICGEGLPIRRNARSWRFA